jgi:hypothetical protein
MASSTWAAIISWKYRSSDYRFQRSLVPHIDSCISHCRQGPFLSGYSQLDRVDMAVGFALAFAESGLVQEAMELREKVPEARRRTLGSEHLDTLSAMYNLAVWRGFVHVWGLSRGRSSCLRGREEQGRELSSSGPSVRVSVLAETSAAGSNLPMQSRAIPRILSEKLSSLA